MSKLRVPEQYTPTPEHLLTLVQRRPMIALREISRELWPDLPWLPTTPGGDSATATLRAFPVGHGTVQKTAAHWLLDRMQDLVVAGHARFAPYREDQAVPGHREGGVSYIVPGAARPVPSMP